MGGWSGDGNHKVHSPGQEILGDGHGHGEIPLSVSEDVLDVLALDVAGPPQGLDDPIPAGVEGRMVHDLSDPDYDRFCSPENP